MSQAPKPSLIVPVFHSLTVRVAAAPAAKAGVRLVNVRVVASNVWTEPTVTGPEPLSIVTRPSTRKPSVIQDPPSLRLIVPSVESLAENAVVMFKFTRLGFAIGGVTVAGVANVTDTLSMCGWGVLLKWPSEDFLSDLPL